MSEEIYGVKWGDWKIIFKENETAFDDTRTFSTPRVYDLINDPGERKDVLLPHAWVAEQALPFIGKHLATFEQYPPIPPGAPDPYVPSAE